MGSEMFITNLKPTFRFGFISVEGSTVKKLKEFGCKSVTYIEHVSTLKFPKKDVIIIKSLGSKVGGDFKLSIPKLISYAV